MLLSVLVSHFQSWKIVDPRNLNVSTVDMVIGAIIHSHLPNFEQVELCMWTHYCSVDGCVSSTDGFQVGVGCRNMNVLGTRILRLHLQDLIKLS